MLVKVEIERQCLSTPFSNNLSSVKLEDNFRFIVITDEDVIFTSKLTISAILHIGNFAYKKYYIALKRFFVGDDFYYFRFNDETQNKISNMKYQ